MKKLQNRYRVTRSQLSSMNHNQNKAMGLFMKLLSKCTVWFVNIEAT